MSTENTRPFLLSLVIMTALSFAPMLSHAAVFWDDEMEEGTSGFSPDYMVSTMIPTGAMAYDTTVKFSGSGSIRLNYTPSCEPRTFGGLGCGGALSRSIPLTDDVYRRVYFRMSGTGPTPSDSGSFETSIGNFTKMLRTVSTGLRRAWWVMGCCGSKRWLHGDEHVPINGATNTFSSITLADNRWYCLETHEKLSTPGVADGILESWVDGVKVLNKTGYVSRIAGSTDQWNGMGVFRQTGRGNIWWDRYAAGDTRIGCLGSGNQTDTTPPVPPQALVIR